MEFMNPVTRRSMAAARIPLCLAATLALAACGSGVEQTMGGTLNGAGASFPSAIYQSWFQQLAGKGLKVNYQSVGSGAGVRQFIGKTVDFAASDAPMKADDLAKVKRGTVQVPMTAGAIAVAYNLPGCDLKLTQAQLVDVFLGKIKNFKELGCANRPINVVHRSDGSGTTYNFTNSLAAFSDAWKKGPGADKSVAWPVGVGAKGNEGVAANLGQSPGSIGYVEASFVKGALQAAALQNRSGEFAKPDNDSASKALDSIDLGPELIGSDHNPAMGYPIVTFTWILLYKSGNGEKAEQLKKVFNTTLSEEFQSQAPKLGYVSLPSAVAAKSKAAVDSISK